jgi:LEA14-like dessication related protein
MKKQICPTLFIVITAYVLTSCGNLMDPEMKGIENIRISRLGLKESTLFLDIHYFNPNGFRLKLKKAEGDAWVDGNPLGHFTMDTLVQIMPRSDFRLPVKLEMDMSHFAGNMSAAFLGKQVLLKVKGTARAGKGFLFFNYPIEYEGKESLSGFLKP